VSDAQYVFVIGPDTSPEVVLFAASIGRVLSRGNDVRFVDDEPEELLLRDPALARLRIHASEVEPQRSRLIMCGDADFVHGRAIGNVWRLSVVCEPSPSMRLETEGKRFGFPLVMSSSLLRRLGRTVAEVPRILVSADGSHSRRERMIGRLGEELVARRWPHTLVVITRSAKVARSLNAGEVHLHSEASEVAALLTSATLVVDPVEGDDVPSTLSCLSSSVGIPSSRTRRVFSSGEGPENCAWSRNGRPTRLPRP